MKKNIKEAENWLLVNEYSWLVKANDKFLSNWEGVTNRHLTIVACKTAKQSVDVQKSMRKDVTFSNIERYPVTKDILTNMLSSSGYSCSIYNEWGRCKYYNDEPEIINVNVKKIIKG